MRTITEVQAEIDAVTKQVRPLNLKLHALDAELRKIKSVAWIEANGVTRDNVQMSEGDGVPWFGIVTEMLRWMKDNGNTKRFFEWNGRIFFTAEGRTPNAPGCVEDLPE